MVIRSEAKRSTVMKEIQQVLVAYDRSKMSQEALKRAISVARKKSAQLMVIHVIEPLFVQSPYAKAIDENAIRREITKEIDMLNTEPQVEYMLFFESGKSPEAIILTAKKTQADLIIVGSHGKDDLNSDYFGSTALKVIQRTHIPVLIVKNSVKNTYQEMIAPTNLSDYSKESILFANTLFTESARKYLYAFETISHLQALTYHFNDEETEELRQIKTTDAAKAFKHFVNEVGEGEMELIDYTASINEDLLEYIRNDRADLLVLGSKGVEGLNSYIFGSTASYLMQRSPIDVLVYVPPGPKTA